MTDETQLTIDVTADADQATVSVALHGEIDTSNAENICAIFTAAHEWAGAKRVVVDLSGVDFMDSSGITALLKCQHYLHEAGVSLEVVGARGSPLRVLEVTGVLEFLSPKGREDVA